MRDRIKAIFGNSLLSKFGRRYADSLRDASSFLDQVNLVRKILPELEQQARSLDKNQVETALQALNELRIGLRELTTKLAVSQGHMHEAGYTGEVLINRLATGAHLSQAENLEYLLRGDVEGLAQYLNSPETIETIKKALSRVEPEKKALLLEALLKDDQD